MEWPKIVNLCLSNLKFTIFFPYELSSEFHSFWNAGKDNEDLRIIGHPNEQIFKSRLFMLQKLHIVLKNGLNILNVQIPKKM